MKLRQSDSRKPITWVGGGPHLKSRALRKHAAPADTADHQPHNLKRVMPDEKVGAPTN